MIDEDLIHKNELAKQALAMLVASGILEEQQDRLLDQLQTGHVDEPDAELLKRIKEYRLRRSSVESLLEVGRGLIDDQGEKP